MTLRKAAIPVVFATLAVIGVSCAPFLWRDPDPAILNVYVEPVQFQDLRSLDLHIQRIDMERKRNLEDPGEIVTVFEAPQGLTLVGFPGATPELYARFPIAGDYYITQLSPTASH